jgi:transcriptional regulator with XRE-family HTH domain
MTISERIFQILKEREISQASFCKMVGLSGSTVSDWKTKKTDPSADKIMDICNALDITPEQLLTGKGIDDNFDEHSSRELDFSFHDKEISLEYHKLSSDQQKRLEMYLKTLKKLDDLEKI